MTAAVIEKTDEKIVAKPSAPKGKAKATKATSDAPSATKAPADVPNASVEEGNAPSSRNDRYASDEVCKEVAAGILAAREAGFTRPLLSELVAAEGGSMGGSALWRSERGKVNKDEVEYITAVLAKIASGELKPPVKEPKNAGAALEAAKERLAKLDAALALLDAGPENKTLAALKEHLAEVHATLR